MPQHNVIQQRGAVLVISLLILLVLTLVGIAGMSSSVLEEKMASNTQKLNETFQTAESAIKSTHNNWVDRPRTLAGLAQSVTATDREFVYDLGGNADASAEVTYIGDVMPINTSLSEDMTAVGIEISGTGVIADTHVASTTVQGYTIQPARR